MGPRYPMVLPLLRLLLLHHLAADLPVSGTRARPTQRRFCRGSTIAFGRARLFTLRLCADGTGPPLAKHLARPQMDGLSCLRRRWSSTAALHLDCESNACHG